MKSFTIGANDDGKRLDRYISKVLTAGGGAIYKALRKKKIKVNGRRVTDGGIRLACGDVIEMYINDELFAARDGAVLAAPNGEPSVVYEDKHIIIMDKPAGLLSQADGSADSLEGRMRRYLYKNGEYLPNESISFTPSLCHRIDRNTAGLVIGAKDAESLRILNRKIKDREIKKFYLCETEGTPSPARGEIHGWLKKNESDRKMMFYDGFADGAAECRTLYRVIKGGKTALVEAELITGRTHQLRAGFAHIGHPLVGDVKYGAKNDGKKRYQHLASYRLVFSYTTDGGILDYLNGREFKKPHVAFGSETEGLV